MASADPDIEPIPAQVYADRHDVSTESVVHQIMTGDLNGDWVGASWVVQEPGLSPMTKKERQDLETEVSETGPTRTDATRPLRFERLSEKQTSSSDSARKKALQRWFLPRYSEISLLVIGLSAVYIAASHITLNNVLAVLFLIAAGAASICLPLYYAFSPTRKVRVRKKLLFRFGAWFEIVVGVVAGTYLLDQPHKGIVAIFPVWNLAHAMLLREALEGFDGETDRVQRRNAPVVYMMAAAVGTGAVLVYSDIVLDHHWALTLSVALAFAHVFDEVYGRFGAPTTLATEST